jgi:hypothetical protein
MNSYKFPLFLTLTFLLAILLTHDTAVDFLAASRGDQLPSLMYGYIEFGVILAFSAIVCCIGWLIDIKTKDWAFAGVLVFLTPFAGMTVAETAAEVDWVEVAISWFTGISFALMIMRYFLDNVTESPEADQPHGGIDQK